MYCIDICDNSDPWDTWMLASPKYCDGGHVMEIWLLGLYVFDKFDPNRTWILGAPKDILKNAKVNTIAFFPKIEQVEGKILTILALGGRIEIERCKICDAMPQTSKVMFNIPSKKMFRNSKEISEIPSVVFCEEIVTWFELIQIR